MNELFGIASIVVALIGYVPYIKDILRQKTKPHAFSWLVWSTLSAIAFAVQVTNNAGSGSWLMGLTAAITLVIFFLSLKHGEKNILTIDWVSLAFAGLALILWLVTDNPLTSIILVSLIDAIGGFFPTFRKSIKKPQEETAVLYLLFGLSLGFSLVALEEFNLINALYPASFVAINWFMWGFLIVRKKQLAGT